MNLLALTFIFPLIGFLILTMGQGRIGEKPATIIGVGAMGLSAVCAFVSIFGFLTKGQQAMSVPLWTWLSVGDFTPKFGLYLEGSRFFANSA